MRAFIPTLTGGIFNPDFIKEKMMKKRAWVIWISLTALLLIFRPEEGLAGIVIEEVNKEVDGSTSKVIRYFSGSQFRTDHPEGGVTIIIDFKEDRMVMIDHRSKTYVETQFSKWEKEIEENVKKSISKIKPKERKIVVRRTGEKAYINAFQTEKIEIRVNGELVEENWVTKDVDMGEAEKVMEKVARSFSKDIRSGMKEGREIYEKLKAYGFPILIKDYTMTYGLGSIDVSEVKRLEKKELGEEIFLPPSDYKRIEPKPSKK
jgi:hypothetical protein